jgi:hypothetical protein
VTIALNLPKRRFREGEAIWLTIGVVNRGKTPIALATPLAFGHTLFLNLEAEKGEIPLSGTLTSSVPGQPRILNGGASLRLRRNLLDLEGFTLPPLSRGRYRLRVCYEYPGSYGDDRTRRKTLPADARKARWVQKVSSGVADFEIGA